MIPMMELTDLDPLPVFVSGAVSRESRMWITGAEQSGTADLFPATVNRAEWRGYGTGGIRFDNTIFSSAGSAEACEAAPSRLCFSLWPYSFIFRMWTWWAKWFNNAPVRRSEPKTSVRQPRGSRSTDPTDYPAEMSAYTTTVPDGIKSKAPSWDRWWTNSPSGSSTVRCPGQGQAGAQAPAPWPALHRQALAIPPMEEGNCESRQFGTGC